MKKLCFFLALALLLSGCTAPTGDASPAPTGSLKMAEPSDASSPAPTATPEKLWWEDKTAADLPTEVEPAGNISSVDGPVCLALLPEADVGLYGDGDPTAGVLLRKGDYVQFFPQTYATARYTLPELSWADVDGDGESELAVKYLVEDTDGDIVYELHFYEWDGKAWTDHPFTQAEFGPLLEGLVSYRYEDGYVTLTAGDSTDRLWYEGDAEPQGLAPIGNLVFFRPQGDGYAVIFGLRLELAGRGPVYDVATLTARLRYDGERFTLSDYVLETVGGV